MSHAVGIEIGGTKLQMGLGLKDGKIIHIARDQVDPTRGAEGIRTVIPQLMDDLLQKASLAKKDISGIGVGFGGPVNSRTGITLKSHQIQGWDNFPLQTWLERQFSCPVTIQNDASTAGYAEAMIGAGRGFSRVFYMTIGSGIGGGWILDGKIDEGQGLGAAEIGHTWLPDPETGEPDRLEQLCSGWSIGRRTREAIEFGEQSSIPKLCGGDIKQITAKTVYMAAEQDDLLALSILDNTCKTLALAICNIIALYHPEKIIIGGGVF